MQSKFTQNAAKMQSNLFKMQNAAKAQQKCSQNSVEIQWKFSQNSDKIQPKFSRNTVEIQSKYSQNSVKIQPKCKQNSVTFMSAYRLKSFKSCLSKVLKYYISVIGNTTKKVLSWPLCPFSWEYRPISKRRVMPKCIKKIHKNSKKNLHTLKSWHTFAMKTFLQNGKVEIWKWT